VAVLSTAAMLVVAMTAVSSCGLLGPAREIVPGTAPSDQALPVESPDPNLANHPVVAAVASSVVKVHSLAPGCQKELEGSGFVVAPDLVMTTAHGVAGSSSVQVDASGNPLDATVVSYDPSADVAILAVPNLPPPLAFAETPAKTGDSVVMLGYPGGGTFTATPARIRENIQLSGPDIYQDPQTVTRDVYTIRAPVEQGNSGGPLIDLNGNVLGLVFGVDLDHPDTGFVLTAGALVDQLARVGATQPVTTGACVS
jgi:S1-C subfamily serine protease